MQTARKSIVSLLLCVVLVLAMLPLDVLAENSLAAPSGPLTATAGDVAGDGPGQSSTELTGGKLELQICFAT